jgi:hypothetical protein
MAKCKECREAPPGKKLSLAPFVKCFLNAKTQRSQRSSAWQEAVCSNVCEVFFERKDAEIAEKLLARETLHRPPQSTTPCLHLAVDGVDQRTHKSELPPRMMEYQPRQT